LVCEGLWQVTLTKDFTRDFPIMQLLLLCITLLNQDQDLVSITIISIPMLLNIPLKLFPEEGQRICVNSMNFFCIDKTASGFAGERP